MSHWQWEWFCGTNSSDLTGDLSVWIDNTCFINGLVAIPHAAFILLFSVSLILLRCFSKSLKTEFLLCYPGHTLRWLVCIGTLLMLVAAVGEGVLTDDSYRAWQYSTQPHYYVPSASALIAVFMSLIYSHHMELWQLPSMSIQLLCYWVTALTGEGMRLANLKQNNLVDVNILKFDLTMVTLVFYCTLVLTELSLIRSNVFRKGGWKNISEKLQNRNMHFVNDYVSIVSKATYWWMNWLFAKGYKKPLEHEDLGDIPERHQAQYNHMKFKEAFDREQARAPRDGTGPSMLRIYIATSGHVMLKAAILKLIGDLMNAVGPLCVGSLTSYVVTIKYEVDDLQVKPHYVTVKEFFSNGFVLVATIFIVLVLKISILKMHYCTVSLESGHIRAGMQTMVYEKALRLASFTTSGAQMTMGEITNHMSTDVANIMLSMTTVNSLWSSPFQIGFILVLLYFQIGFSALLGASLFLVVLPIQVKVAGILAEKQKAILGCSDQRLKQTNELLQGIKLLKMYAWEQLYCKAIEAIRQKEMGHLLHINLCMITSNFMTMGFPVVVCLVAFATYTALHGLPLTPEITFASFSLFNEILLPLFVIPISLSDFISAKVSSKRLMKFFLAPEVEGNRALSLESDRQMRCPIMKQPREMLIRTRGTASGRVAYIATQTDELEMDIVSAAMDDENVSLTSARKSDPCTAVKITNGKFAWDLESRSPVLFDINVDIPAGKLTMVIGQVGSGKSSLLSAILGEMRTCSGHVRINEDACRMAYAAQKPWLLNDSLRDNVLFSAKLDHKRYESILEACALHPDIEILPAGDLTEIGEKGINLSGGQKQRVSVARAIYADRDIVILDDPLSALDVHVGRQLFEEGIMKLLLGNNKTVILVTHQLQYLSRADLILEMKDGRIAAKGNLNDIIKADPEMYEEIKQVSAVGWDSGQAENTEEERHALQQGVSKESAKADGKLVEEEEMVRGSVSYKTYLYLMGNIGWGSIFWIFVTFPMKTSSAIVTNFWLSSWSESGLSNQSDRTETEYLAGYAGLSVATALSQLLATATVILTFMIGAKRLHLSMLRNIVRAPLRFFDTTLIGRIMNRFSNDTQMVDSRTSMAYDAFFFGLAQCISSVVVVSIVMPIFLVFILPIAVVYYFLQKYYLSTARELHRLNNTSKSPVFAYFFESLGGLSTIRAYRQERVFYNTILTRIDKNTTAFLYLQIAVQWLGLRMEFLGASFVLLATGSTLIGALVYGIDPSLVGLSSSYALMMSSSLGYLLSDSAEVEMQMNAIERIKHYCDVESESYEGKTPPSDWPRRGDITIENISVRYAEGLDAVLSAVSVCVKAGEKVGICGRTGSGKSSLTLALLRVIDVFKGQIFIDDVNIKSVPLTTLRSKISIIPQDPVLFTGPIRANLDPDNKLSDDELWRALEISQLKEVVAQLDEGLDSKVTEGGDNFSVGQRQLFCLARAFLRKSRILIMDEATASVDMETDKTLQTVVASTFANRTVLTIAHRIATIRTSDKIIVLDGGRVAEFGSPKELLANEDGIFSSLVRAH